MLCLGWKRPVSRSRCIWRTACRASRSSGWRKPRSGRHAKGCARPSRTPAWSFRTTSIVVNLAPADLPKDSGRFALPIALGILAASGQIQPALLAGHEFAGELSLSGELRPVRGALAMALALHTRGIATHLVLPAGSAREAALVPGSEVYGARHLLDVVQRFMSEGTALQQGEEQQQPAADGWARVHAAAAPLYADLADVKGHAGAKRALEIAAAGGHSLLMMGEPGSGKSMLAQRFAGLLPPMSVDEALESAAVASLAGSFSTARWMNRPTSAPHHTSSAVALVGGGVSAVEKRERI
ncbi:putative Mg chelatase [Variovorax paradoxus B4]|uniref:Putative Mg chelatase n=1 Tax=Variovorax paradoxus B4 TaxID=1246301 RepID=T1X4Y4_VARPD|nr:putative Mg chelatase [Variovorax paradoxus B4]